MIKPAKESRIKSYFHCRTCLVIEKLPDGTDKVSSNEHLAVGWTVEGLQIVCENCGRSVADLDFLGNRVAYYKKDASRPTGRHSKKGDNGKEPSLHRKK